MQKIVQLILISGGGPTPLAAPETERRMSCNCSTLLKPLVFCGLKRSFIIVIVNLFQLTLYIIGAFFIHLEVNTLNRVKLTMGFHLTF